MSYLNILLIFLLSAVFLEWKFRVRLYHSLKERIIIVMGFFVIFIAWDYLATFLGHWAFLGDGLLGIYIGILPIEEYLFVLIVPYWGITFYKVLEKKFHHR